MLDVRQLKAEDLQGLDAVAASRIAALLLARVAAIDEEHDKQFSERDEQIKFKDAKLQKLIFELARLKRLKFGAKTEAMTTDQRRLFEEALAEDEAALQARIDALRNAKTPAPPAGEARTKRQPRRQPIPEHLRRVEHRHEPDDTTCPATGCGRPMVRIGEDVSERLDIVPAEFFAHRHIRGKWTCKCCQALTQEPVDPQLIDKGLPAPGLVAHVLVSRFVDHIPYYRQETINARSGVHTPRTTLASWAGAGGAELEPLGEAHKAFVLGSAVLHADETLVPMLDPGAGKTKKAYIWGYARSEFDGLRGVVYDFCVGRGAKYPRRSSMTGTARSFATTTRATSPSSSSAAASRRAALYTHDASSRSCSRTGTRARWPRRRSGAWPGSFGSRSKPERPLRRSAWSSGKTRLANTGTN